MLKKAMPKYAPLLFLVPVAAALVWAAEPQGFKMWKSQELKSFAKSEMLGEFGNHNARVTFRDNDGEVEVHDNWTDVLIIETGEAAVMIGGMPVNPKSTGPGEWRAATATGAEKKMVAPGDILNIPAGVPHQFLVASGKKITYFALKVPAK
jgi:mannose-6-phosphate isomerase-like protein (cupin superfamily)